MNPRTAKEFRVLLPAFALTLSASVLPFWMFPKEPEPLMMVLWAFGCVVLAALPFGDEFQRRTLPLLLSQPVPRTTLWREKMQPAAAAIAVGTGLLVISTLAFDTHAFREEFFGWIVFSLVPLCAFCATPYWTLLVGNVLVGVLFSFLAPFIILMTNELVHVRLLRTQTFEEQSAIVLLVMYSLACAWLGYLRFKKLQVTDAASIFFSQELKVPARLEGVVRRLLKILSRRFTGPTAALLRKELRLHQISFLLAGVFCVVAAVGAIAYLNQLKLSVEGSWGVFLLLAAFTIYVLILPLIVGAASVAEENGWGVTNWHLTLPPSIRKQWSIKMLVALSVSLLLGGFLPAFVALTIGLFSGQLLSALDTSAASFFGDVVFFVPHVMLPAVLSQLLLTTIVIYAACFSTRSIQAIVLAFGMVLAMGCALMLGQNLTLAWRDLGLPVPHVLLQERFRFYGQDLWSIGAFIMLCLTQLFAFHSYRARRPAPLQIVLQATVLLGGICLLHFLVLIWTGVVRW